MSYLVRNEAADQFHLSGLQAAQENNFEEAHLHFGHAIELIPKQPETADTITQIARITRDIGFTTVRAALDKRQVNNLILTQIEDGRQLLLQSANMTLQLVGGLHSYPFEKAQPHDTPKQARREIWSEHGATLTFLGRTATVQQQVSETNKFSKAESVPRASKNSQQAYGSGHDFLKIGNNGYYKVINAMVGARQERINGRLPHALKWVQRAGDALAWTALYDRQNLGAAIHVFAERSAHLRSAKVAKNSVITKP